MVILMYIYQNRIHIYIGVNDLLAYQNYVSMHQFGSKETDVLPWKTNM